MARPVAEVEVLLGRTTIIMALDLSRRMCAPDVNLNRTTTTPCCSSRWSCPATILSQSHARLRRPIRFRTSMMLIVK